MKKLKKIGLAFLLIGAILFASCSNNSNSSSNPGNADGSPSVDAGSSGSTDKTPTTTPIESEKPSKDDPPEETPSYVRVPQKYKDPVSGKTAAEIIEMMGPGWNLGNTLDAARVDYSDNKYYQADEGNLGVSTEESWGIPKTTKAMIDVVAAAGFSHVRAPVSWHNHVDASGNIETVWLERVKEIVDWIIGDGMFCVINIHHDTWDGQSGFWGYSVDGTHESESIAFVEKIWDQVAKYFKDYDQRLVFETLNEPRVRGHKVNGNDHEWTPDFSCGTCQKAATTINTLNKKALDKIRAGGGKNNERLVIVPPYVASPDAAFNNNFVMPTDSVSNLLAISVHAYQPYTFAMKPDGESNFTSSHESQLNTLFTNLANLSYPVFIGEFSATNRGNSAERVKWAEYYVNGTSSRKMAYCLWDNNDFDKNKDLSERHGHLNRSANPLCWYDEAFIKAVTGKQDLSGDTSTSGGSSGEGSGGEYTRPTGAVAISLATATTYVHESYSSTKKMTVSGSNLSFGHTSSPEQYASGSITVDNLKNYTTVEIKVTNTGSSEATVKVGVQRNGTAANNWNDNEAATTEVKAGSGTSLTVLVGDASGAQTTIAAGSSKIFVVSFDKSKNPDQITVALNSEKAKASNPTSGSITISEAYMY